MAGDVILVTNADCCCGGSGFICDQCADQVKLTVTGCSFDGVYILDLAGNNPGALLEYCTPTTLPGTRCGWAWTGDINGIETTLVVEVGTGNDGKLSIAVHVRCEGNQEGNIEVDQITSCVTFSTTVTVRGGLGEPDPNTCASNGSPSGCTFCDDGATFHVQTL